MQRSRESAALYEGMGQVVGALVERIESILRTRSSYELWLRSDRPYDGGAFVVREREDGTMLVHDQARTEIFSAKNRFDLWEWLNERGFHRVGCYVEKRETK